MSWCLPLVCLAKVRFLSRISPHTYSAALGQPGHRREILTPGIPPLTMRQGSRWRLALLCLFDSGSQLSLHLRISWGAFKNPSAYATPQTEYLRIAGGGTQASTIIFKFPCWRLCVMEVENHVLHQCSSNMNVHMNHLETEVSFAVDLMQAWDLHF